MQAYRGPVCGPSLTFPPPPACTDRAPVCGPSPPPGVHSCRRIQRDAEFLRLCIQAGEQQQQPGQEWELEQQRQQQQRQPGQGRELEWQQQQQQLAWENELDQQPTCTLPQNHIARTSGPHSGPAMSAGQQHPDGLDGGAHLLTAEEPVLWPEQLPPPAILMTTSTSFTTSASLSGQAPAPGTPSTESLTHTSAEGLSQASPLGQVEGLRQASPLGPVELMAPTTSTAVSAGACSATCTATSSGGARTTPAPTCTATCSSAACAPVATATCSTAFCWGRARSITRSRLQGMVNNLRGFHGELTTLLLAPEVVGACACIFWGGEV